MIEYVRNVYFFSSMFSVYRFLVIHFRKNHEKTPGLNLSKESTKESFDLNSNNIVSRYITECVANEIEVKDYEFVLLRCSTYA